MQITKIPLSALEVQSILGLPANSYAIAVSAGILLKSAYFAERCSTRTSLHTFDDLLHFVLWAHLDTWSGLLDQEDLCQILAQIEEIRLNRTGVNLNTNLTLKLTSKLDVEATIEVKDEIRRAIARIDVIWCSLLQSVQEAVNTDSQYPKKPTSDEQSDLLKSILLSNFSAVTRGYI